MLHRSSVASGLLCMLGLAALIAPAQAEPPPSSCSPSVEDGLVTLEAAGCSLIGVLEELGRKADFELIADAAQDTRISVRFEKLPVDQAIRRIAGKAGYLEVTDPQDRTTRVVLTSKQVRLARTASKPYEPPPPPMSPPPEDPPPSKEDNTADGQEGKDGSGQGRTDQNAADDKDDDG